MKCEVCNKESDWWAWEDGERTDARCPECGAQYSLILFPPKVREVTDDE